MTRCASRQVASPGTVVPAPGAAYPHAHDADEQTLVIEGDLSFGDLALKAGDFHAATPSSSRPPGRTANGCWCM